MLFVPIIIILGIFAFSFATDLVKNGVISLPKLDLGFGFKLFPQIQEKPAKQPTKSQSVLRQSPLTRAPPPPSPQISKKEEKPTVSPYLKKVRISSFRPTKDSQPALITLSANFWDESKIKISGWKIKSQWIGEFTIPKGIEKYHPILNAEPVEEIWMKKSDTVYLKGEQSPFGRGRNFRPNSCFGYLKVFYPGLPGPSSCHEEKPKIEEIRHLKPTCQEFVFNKIDYSSCQPPDYSKDPAVAGDKECVSYIIDRTSGFHYEGCYQKRSQDQNFLSNEWYIYMDTTFGHTLHDTITLFDENGLVVDTYIY